MFIKYVKVCYFQTHCVIYLCQTITSDKYNKTVNRISDTGIRKMVIRISDKVIQLLKSNLILRNRLANDLIKSPRTIDRWISENDECLTMALVLKIIREETGLGVEEILEEVQM